MTTAEAHIQYIAPFKPRFERQDNGKFAMRAVPIFECHDDRGWECNAEWMRETVSQQFTDKMERSFLPRVIIGHTDDDQAEKPVEAFLDNFQYDEATGWLYADIVDVPLELKELLEDNKFPGRSVEVFPEKNTISALALLGGSKPFFKLPDLRFEDHKSAAVYYHFQYQKEADTVPHKEDEKNSDHENDKQTFTDEQEARIAKMITEAMAKRQDSADDSHKENYQMDKEGKDDQGVNLDGDAGVPRQDYEDLKSDVKRYADANEVQAARILELEETGEKSKWVQKYNDLRVPQTILNTDEHVKVIMTLPAEHREKYFDGTTKHVRSPETNAIDDSDHKKDEGIDQVSLRKFYDEHPEFRGDTVAATKAYKAQNPGLKYTG